MNTPAPLLELKDISLSYLSRSGLHEAVSRVSFSIEPGERIGLVGETGCGKTTIALGILGYLGDNGYLTGGELRFKGQDMSVLSPGELRQLRGNDIAMVYQDPTAVLNPSMRIWKQLAEVPMSHEGISLGEAKKRAKTILEEMHILDPERVMEAYPHQLSGGQCQRVVIAMALLGNPSLLILDEPTTALDSTTQANIIQLMTEIGLRYNTAMLFISHDLGMIANTCERLMVMYAGEVVEQGQVADVFANPRHPYTQGLLRCIPLPTADKDVRPVLPIPGRIPQPGEQIIGCQFGPRCFGSLEGTCDKPQLPLVIVDDVTSHGVRCVRWEDVLSISPEAPPEQPTLTAGEESFRVEGLQKYYPISDGSFGSFFKRSSQQYIRANESVSFSARQRETVAIVGESGCGKSTFAKVLAGLETATAGEVLISGVDVGRTPVEERTVEQIASVQIVFQNPDETLNPSLSIGRQIGRVLKKFGRETDTQRIRQRVAELMDSVKLSRDLIDEYPHRLSGGQKQRVAIARACAGEPALVVADEPLSALDVSVQAAVGLMLMDIQRQHDTTLLLISHDLGQVRYLAERVVVMYLGQVMETGRTEDVFAPPYHPYTEALIAAVSVVHQGVSKRQIFLEGAQPDPSDPPLGCPFHSRCPRKIGEICETEAPPLRGAGDSHFISCHISVEELSKVEPVLHDIND
jgi:peptide/nickel transport system ATP-binding protein